AGDEDLRRGAGEGGDVGRGDTAGDRHPAATAVQLGDRLQVVGGPGEAAGRLGVPAAVHDELFDAGRPAGVHELPGPAFGELDLHVLAAFSCDPCHRLHGRPGGAADHG